MADSVLVFSADELRGKIVNKVLGRNGAEKAKKIISQKNKRSVGSDTLEKTLKKILNLD